MSWKVFFFVAVMQIANELRLHATAPDEVYYELGMSDYSYNYCCADCRWPTVAFTHERR